MRPATESRCSKRHRWYATLDWSPDGAKIAVATERGTVLVDTATWSHTLATATTPGTLDGLGRPAWYPGRGLPRTGGTKRFQPRCRSCL